MKIRALTRLKNGFSVGADVLGVTSSSTFDAEGKVVRGSGFGLSPNDVLFIAWRQQQDVRWSQARCREEWARLGNAEPREDL